MRMGFNERIASLTTISGLLAWIYARESHFTYFAVLLTTIVIGAAAGVVTGTLVNSQYSQFYCGICGMTWDLKKVERHVFERIMEGKCPLCAKSYDEGVLR